jgi:4-methoxybenzoate monooxygenase (O-demethylating)
MLDTTAPMPFCFWNMSRPCEYAPVLVPSILRAGFDTTGRGLNNAIYGLATNCGQGQTLGQSPALLRTALDQIIRWESPLQTLFCTTSNEVEIARLSMGANRKVLALASAR